MQTTLKVHKDKPEPAKATDANFILPPKKCNIKNNTKNIQPVPSHLSPFRLVFAVFGEQMAEDVCAAAGHVHQRTLLAEAEPRGDG